MTRESHRYTTVSRAGFSVRIHRRSAAVVIIGLLLLIGLSIYSLTLGDYGLSAGDSFRRLLGDGGPRDDFLGVYFVQSVRLPRMLAAVAVGCALGISGRIFQTISGNPLGSPDIVGLSTGCATGALIAIIVLGSSPAVTGFGALLGGLLSGVLILACAGGMRVTGIRVVLVGIGCSAALRAINSLLIVVAILLVACATAVAGPVAFVALSAPHIAHRLCGGGGVGFASSALVGALLVLTSDVCAQRLIAPAELPVGVVTGVVGGLYLLWLLIREVRS